MKRITFVLLYALLAATTAPAQVWIGGTNEKSGVVAPLLYTNFLAGSFRVTVAALDGGSPIDLSLDRVSLQVEDTRDGKLVVSNACIRLDDYTYRGEGSLSASPSPYTLKVQVYPAANPSAFYPIYWASVTITSTPSAGGGGNVAVNVVLTNDTDMAELVAIGQPSGLVAVTKGDGTTDLLPYGGGSSGGGDSPAINGEHPTNLVFNASYPFTLTKTTNAQGMVLTYGLSGTAGTIVIPAGNTSTSHFYYVSTNAQYYTAGPTATQLLVFAVGSAAGFSAGGVGFRYVPCTGSQVFACYVPEGGEARTNGVARGGWGYVPGGDATSTNSSIAVSGSGSLAFLSGTNVELHLGAAGGGPTQWARANGGGLIGFSFGAVSSGSGGTQTNHGAGASGNTNSIAGSSTNGGHGIALGGFSPGSGGGGGHYSGGGGAGSVSANNNLGGAGSTLIYDGITSRSAADSASPPSTDNALYKAPYGVGQLDGTSLTNFNRGNSGLIAILSYPES